MKANTNNKHSAKKKLIPAVAMLTTSAIMLSTATYAWFTMNKEVEVTGLSMSATASDSLEISLGSYGTDNVLTIKQPGKDDSSWSRLITIGEYYNEIGKLKPCSTANALNMYAVDETQIRAGGREVTGSAKVFSVSNDHATPTESKYGPALLLAKAKHAIGGTLTSVSSGSALATNSSFNTSGTNYSAENETSASGYYVDIPMWIRSSESQDHKVNCTVTITDPDDTNGSKLINAVRVAIIPTGDANKSAQTGADIAGGATSTASSKINASLETDESQNIFALPATEIATKYYNDQVIGASNITSGTTTFSDALTTAPTTVAAADAQETSPAQAGMIANNGAADNNTITKVFTLPGAVNDEYAVQAFIARVWIEGQSTSCNDATANQDWNIDFHFELGEVVSQGT